MSELEIQRRKNYKRNRKRWMIVQIILIVLVSAVALGSFWVYNQMNRTYYIEYTEKGTIDYKVQYRENEFFESEWIDKDQSYISSLIEGINATFVYRLNANSSDLGFSYQYRINAKLLVASKDTGTPYYTYEECIFPPKDSDVKNSSSVYIGEAVTIDYVRFNDMATQFVNTYGLQNSASCTLIVTMEVDVMTSNKQFDKQNQNSYSTSLNIPLVVDTFNIHATSSSPDNEVKVLEYQSVADREIFFISGASAAGLDALLLLILVIFLHLTKNDDITYAAKIRKILRSYGSFIQRMSGEFISEGYQVVKIKTFVEMLGIRDTLQAPVLMSENRDETATRFYIPTSTKILYLFEIKVDNYDEIYGLTEPLDLPVDLETETTEETEAAAEDAEIVLVPETAESTTEAPAETEPADEEKSTVKGDAVCQQHINVNHYFFHLGRNKKMCYRVTTRTKSKPKKKKAKK